ncbi:MAG: Gfo/Idh/MocA family protein [Acetanaerobacterium sp.]
MTTSSCSEHPTYALIGCGRIAPNHIAAALENGLHVSALCDLDPRLAAALADRFSLPDTPVYSDYTRMLAEVHPQLAAIATESGSHARIALDCIGAGCGVIVEKPMALSLTDADRMIAAAEQQGVVLSVCHQNRFNKSIAKIRRAVEDGRFARMMYGTAHIRWHRGEDYYRQAPWRGRWAQDGGALMNQCIHNIDLLRWMLGDDVSEVFAYTENVVHPYIEAEDLGLALVRFTNGALGLIEGTTAVYPANLEETLYLFGERGTVKAGGKSVNRIEVWQFGDGKDDEEGIRAMFCEDPPNVYGYGHTPLYADVLDAMRTHRAPAIDGAAGRRALELVLAVYLSAARGTPVRLPLSACASADFEGRFEAKPVVGMRGMPLQ